MTRVDASVAALIANDPPALEHDATLRLGRNLGIVGHQHRSAPFAFTKLEQDVEHPPTGVAIEAPRRLIGEQNGRSGDERARQGHALLLAPRELTGVVVHALREADAPEQLPRAVGRFPVSRQLERQRNVLLRREIRQKLKRLEHEADLVAAQHGEFILGARFQGHAIEQNATVGRPIEPSEETEQSRLSAPRGPDDGNELAGGDPQIQPVENGQRAISRAQPLGEASTLESWVRGFRHAKTFRSGWSRRAATEQAHPRPDYRRPPKSLRFSPTLSESRDGKVNLLPRNSRISTEHRESPTAPSRRAALASIAAWASAVALSLTVSCHARTEPGDSNGSEAPNTASEVVQSRGSSARDTIQNRGPIVAFLGDSITAGLHIPVEAAYPAVLGDELRALDLPIQVVNAGVSGDTTAGGRTRLAWILRQKPDVLVIELGANDGLRGIPLAVIRDNLRAIVTEALTANTRVLLLGMRLPPNYGEAYARGFAALYDELAEELTVPVVPHFMDGVAGVPELNLPDGIHPTAAGHEILARNIAPALRSILEERARGSTPAR